MRRKFNFSVEEFYHIYNRGTDKRVIFLETTDHNRFVTLLYLCNSIESVDIDHLLRGGLSFPELIEVKVENTLVDIGAWCLMPNHFHLLIKEKQEGGISLFMKKLLTAYSMYFNKKHQRKGRLFEGSFSASHAPKDEYLKYLFSYIHLNPVKLVDPLWKDEGIKDIETVKKYLDDYTYSSYLDYKGFQRRENKILNKSSFPDYFSDAKDFQDHINDWLEFKHHAGRIILPA